MPLPRPYQRVQPGPLSREQAAEINRALDDVYRLLGTTVTAPLRKTNGQGGDVLAIDLDPPRPARIDDLDPETGAYGWTEMSPVSIDATPSGYGHWAEKVGGLSGLIDLNPAYERNGKTDVPVGRIVLLWRGCLNDTGSREWIFDSALFPVPAKISGTDDAPTTTLDGDIDDAASSLDVASAAGWPGRPGYRFQIDDEVFEITGGESTTTWAIQRGVDGTEAAEHTDGATIAMVGAYSWDEVEPDHNGKWAVKSGGLSGTAVVEPAYERNHSTTVEAGTYVLLWRRLKDAEGVTQLDGSLDESATSYDVLDATVFPATGTFYVRIKGEIMRVTGVALTGGSDTLTVERGVGQTEAYAHDDEDDVVEVIEEWVFDHCCGDGEADVPDPLTVNELTVNVRFVIPPRPALPSNPRPGQRVTLESCQEYVYKASGWQQQTTKSDPTSFPPYLQQSGGSLLMPGTILAFGGVDVPSGYLPCDGSAVSRTGYADLFNAIGDTWGVGDGSTTFNVPDLQRRALVGSGGSGTATLGNAIGDTGGAETHTLLEAEMPAHTHTPPSNDFYVNTAGTAFAATTGVIGNIVSATASTGGGGAHNNVQPSAVVTYIIKV